MEGGTQRLRSHLFGSCFERLCREALPRLYLKQGINTSFEVGEYWDSEVQIDVVGLRDDGWTDLGECKWGRVRSVPQVERELKQKRALFPNTRGSTLQEHVFAQTKPKGRTQLPWHSLEELYAL